MFIGGKGGGGALKEAFEVESPEEWEDIGPPLMGSTSSIVSYSEMHEDEVKRADGEEEDVLVRLLFPFVDCCL